MLVVTARCYPVRGGGCPISSGVEMAPSRRTCGSGPVRSSTVEAVPPHRARWPQVHTRCRWEMPPRPRFAAASPRAEAQHLSASGPCFKNALMAAGIAVDPMTGEVPSCGLRSHGEDARIQLCEDPAPRLQPARSLFEEPAHK